MYWPYPLIFRLAAGWWDVWLTSPVVPQIDGSGALEHEGFSAFESLAPGVV
jgi:hypothetical protein